MQLLSAVALACVAASGGQGTAALAYGAYMVAQNMSEPGMFMYLMDRVPERERSGVSALNFLVASSTQAIAAGFADSRVAANSQAQRVRTWFATWAELGWICAPELESLIKP